MRMQRVVDHPDLLLTQVLRLVGPNWSICIMLCVLLLQLDQIGVHIRQKYLNREDIGKAIHLVSLLTRTVSNLLQRHSV